MIPGQATSRCAAVLFAAFACACSDHGRASEEHAVTWSAAAVTLATNDVNDLREGFPKATAKLMSLYANGADPANDLTAVHRGLRTIRAEVPELTRSSSTFFALTDAHGIAIRNDLDQDVMAGQDVFKLFPDLKKATDAPFATAAGLFAGARGPGEPDRDWVAAAPVKDASGAFRGLLIGGWTMKRFAYHLEEALRHDLTEEQAKTKDPGKLPIVYVSVFDATGVYSAPRTPSVNQKALADLGLVGKTASGPAHGVLTITERDFGYAAVRLPALEPEAGVVLLWSEI